MRKFFSTILVSILVFFCAYATVKGPIWYYHEQAKQEFMNGDTKLDENIKKIYDKYGIVVHKQLEDYMTYFFWDTEITQEYNEESATELVEDLYYYLEIYSDKVIKTLPKDIYLVEMSNRKGSTNILYPAFIGNFGMVLSVGYYELCFYELPKVLNHEIFHAITNNFWTWEDYKNYKAIDENCSEISDYACTSIKEELSEAWSLALDKKYTKKGVYLLENYKNEYLRDLEVEYERKPKIKFIL